ncbi:hypothetical protein LTR56_001731 [Elasticomyces elasticus]|nr:hypothetical protein LTR22_020358 [Elasticomyces elasticus]KAK3658860.1 hypothetical protein LTR56_001731 [Elasticomyces elasticus]KAK4932703.1 hypothetical protein LTR49_001127 [Elasticomyces elasticus]KAK5769725.1 hypothetical protein LTS12_000175 [Elasticomyces elasticus]
MGALFSKPSVWATIWAPEFYHPNSSMTVNVTLPSAPDQLTIMLSPPLWAPESYSNSSLTVNVIWPKPPNPDLWPIILGPPLALGMIWSINRLEERRRWLARFPRERGRRRNTIRAFFYVEPKSYKQPIPWDPTDPTFNREEYEDQQS